jgi:hypothetical protein
MTIEVLFDNWAHDALRSHPDIYESSDQTGLYNVRDLRELLRQAYEAGWSASQRELGQPPDSVW